MTSINLPYLAEGVSSATVSFIFVKTGDVVKEGDAVIELVTDKATFNVPAPLPGTIRAILVNEGDQINVGQELIRLE